MRQYEIRWANMPGPIGRRPVLLLSRTPAYDYLNKVIIVEITSTIRRIPQEMNVGQEEGLARPSVVNFDNIHVVAKTVLEERIGYIDLVRETEVKRALGYALDWPELKVL